MLLWDLVPREAPVNWKLFFANSNRGLCRCKSRLFLVDFFEIWDLLKNLSCKFSGHMPYRISCGITYLSYFINFKTGNQSRTHPSLCFPYSINFWL